ncbi:MAG: DNA alkylation repair protein [Desulfobacterales bacterium]|nr:DNA alkylation repair protein [Desulfobacterales bacterium]
MMIKQIQNELKKHSNDQYAAHHQIFFKTQTGGYGEGDIFIGVRVPKIRQVAKQYKNIGPDLIEKLLRSKIHEYRMIALIIMVNRFSLKSTNLQGKEDLFDLYIKNKDRINNWDLVDISAPHIVGGFLFEREKDVLYNLSKSMVLWDRRIAILATFYFIRKNDFKHTIKISKILLHDNEDLIHKAVGWMLREIGKRDMQVEEKFLKKEFKKMPRTMLRYAIEKFPEDLRQNYLKA